MKPGQYTCTEILSQPDAWAETLESVKSRADDLRGFFHAREYQAVIFTGCGSTYYLAMAAATLFQELSGIPSRGLPASEIWLYPRSALARQRTLLVAISRSGETTETLQACEHFIESRGHNNLLTLSCYPGATLTTLRGTNLVLPTGQEQSVAQTRAFTTLYLTCTALAGLWAGREDWLEELTRLPAVGERLLTEHRDLARQWANEPGLDRFFFLGSGPRYGLACEMSLKMKEMSLSHSEPFHFLEFRHGPKSMATRSTLIFGLVSESHRADELAVLNEMRDLGAHVIAVGENEREVAFASGVGEWARNVLYLPVGQLIAFERAIGQGLNPDAPRHLSAVVQLTT